jgi:predicted GH43/DUF377 family glycosyl hydrolase
MAKKPPQVRRRPEQFISDNRRVITRVLIPGGEERIKGLLKRIRNLTDEEAQIEFREVMDDFAGRHRNIEHVFDDHFQHVSQWLDDGHDLPEIRRRLIGAYFTMEYSIESAALFNPSIVPHYDQAGLPDGSLRFIMSLRATGEGHISSIVFRTGVINADGDITMNPCSRYVGSARPDPEAVREKRTYFYKLIEMGGYSDIAGEVLDRLSPRFAFADLERVIGEMRESADDVDEFNRATDQMLWLARSNYTLQFPDETPLSEVVIFPVTENESRGIEDARFVRFTDDDGESIYYGTYTAYNGFQILPQLLLTKDFRRFSIVTLNGKYAQNKGMALFPGRINGRYVMISRQDGENLHIMSSTNIRFWNEVQLLRPPTYPWELIQIGNCGSPIETDKGWLLLTHGVGPMRRYCIGADLLDLENPSKVIAHAREPIIVPNEKEREGYVPNVVYSCGAIVHNGQLIIPYAMSDSATSFASMELDELLAYLLD